MGDVGAVLLKVKDCISASKILHDLLPRSLKDAADSLLQDAPVRKFLFEELTLQTASGPVVFVLDSFVRVGDKVVARFPSCKGLQRPGSATTGKTISALYNTNHIPLYIYTIHNITRYIIHFLRPVSLCACEWLLLASMYSIILCYIYCCVL